MRNKGLFSRITAVILSGMVFMTGMAVPTAADEIINEGAVSSVSEAYAEDTSDGIQEESAEEASESVIETPVKNDAEKAEETSKNTEVDSTRDSQSADDALVDEDPLVPVVVESSAPSEYGYIEMQLPDDLSQGSASVSFYNALNQTAAMPAAFGEFDWSTIFTDLGDVNVQTPDTASQGPVRNQGGFGMCWSFSPMASAESYLRRHYGLGTSLDLSELQMAYYTFFRNASSQPEGCKNDIFEWPYTGDNAFYWLGGNDTIVIGTLGRGIGFTDEQTVPYSWLPSSFSDDLVNGDLATSSNTYVLKNARITMGANIDRIKTLLMENGSVSAAVNYTNIGSHTTLQVAEPESASNHAITIVGWYDDFPKEYFSTASGEHPTTDGAWLIQNSYGAGYYNNNQGYFWASYEDGALQCHQVVSYEAAPVSEAYDHIYQYDGSPGLIYLIQDGLNGLKGMANVFTSDQDEMLEAVSFYTLQQDLDYTVSVYTGITDDPKKGTLAGQISGHLTYAGLNTLTLDTPISLAEGEKYAVYVQLSGQDAVYLVMEHPSFGGYTGTAGVNAGESYYVRNMGYGSDSWYDVKNQNGYYNFRIKAYTNNSDHKHSYGNPQVTKAATCTENGLQVYTCTVCGHQKSEVIPALGHSMVKVSGTAADCTHAGKTEGSRCNRCGYTVEGKVIPALGHNMVKVSGTAADCTHAGKTEGSRCSRCGYTVEGEVIPALGHDYHLSSRVADSSSINAVQVNYKCSRCQDIKTTSTELPNYNKKYDRIYGTNRVATSVNVADKFKKLLGKTQVGQEEKLDTVVLASSQNFPDALAGSYLAAQKMAPMLLINGAAPDTTLDYLKKNMNKSGTIYILGGTSVIPDSIKNSLIKSGFNVERLSGSNRYATNIEILKSAGTTGQKELVICSGNGFADSLSASSTGRPILIVNQSLNDEQKTWLKDNKFDKYVILGGNAAVSQEVRNYILKNCAGGDKKRIEELAGKNRYDTSAQAAAYFFPNATRVLLASGSNFPDGLSGGAYAYLLNCPVLLADQGHVNEAKSYASNKNRTYCVTLGGPTIIRDVDMKNIYP